ncbi:MAG: DUF3080 domain-containing protein [bacterium]|nr:DUF3080 domain-containing protein [bacterium]
MPGRPLAHRRASRRRDLVSRLALRGWALLMSALGLVSCGEPSTAVRLRYVRAGVEDLLNREASPVETRVVALPPRRERIMAVDDHTIGPFDFLATIGCRLSEVVASRNAALGRVLQPTRRLAHELDVIGAVEACLPTLGEERADRLAGILVAKQGALSRHAWNAIWLDEDLERFLSSGPAALIGGRDPKDGARQLLAAASAMRIRDVDALQDAFEQLRDDPAAGPRLRDAAAATSELERIAALVATVPADRCSAAARQLVRIFSERFVPVRGPLADLDRDAQGLAEGVRAAFEALDPIEASASMQAYRVAVAGSESDPGVAGSLRAAIVGHARAWSGVLAACEALPGAS